MNATYTMQSRWGGTGGSWQGAGDWTFPIPILALDVAGDGSSLSGTVNQAISAGMPTGVYNVSASWNESTQDYTASLVAGDNGVTQSWNFNNAQIFEVDVSSTDGGSTVTGGAQLIQADGPLDVQGSLP
jgi:hypothetical protein